MWVFFIYFFIYNYCFEKTGRRAASTLLCAHIAKSSPAGCVQQQCWRFFDQVNLPDGRGPEFQSSVSEAVPTAWSPLISHRSITDFRLGWGMRYPGWLSLPPYHLLGTKSIHPYVLSNFQVMAINYYRIIKVYVQSNQHYKVHVLYTYSVLAAGSELTASVR